MASLAKSQLDTIDPMKKYEELRQSIAQRFLKKKDSGPQFNNAIKSDLTVVEDTDYRIDSRIKCNSLKALTYTRRLAEEEGIFAGVSTGASLAVAVRVCQRLPEGSSVVALSPDGGWKYLSTGAYAQGDVAQIAEQISGTLWA